MNAKETGWQAARGEGRWGGFPCRMKCPGRASQWARRESAAGLEGGGDGSSVPPSPTPRRENCGDIGK